MIIRERLDTYRDFTINLLNNIYYYYIDRESLNNDEDINNHFNWCFNKVCDKFLEEGLNFKENDKLKKYFHNFYYNQFYLVDDKPDIQHYLIFWDNVFDLDSNTNKNVSKIMIELYKIYDTSINKKEEECVYA